MGAKTLCCVVVALLVAGGCSTRFDHVGKGPTMTPPNDPRGTVPREFKPMPVTARRPDPSTESPGLGSLWHSGPQSLFGDRRARTVGDILTVLIEIDDQAQIRNRSNRIKTGEENLNAPALFGLPSLAADVLPGGAGLAPALDIDSTSRTVGDGLIQRQERITLRVAATVKQVLPNGHLMIVGDQEIRVNNELRDLQVAGVIRPEDISRQNIITYDKIAGARIAYGGRGQLMDLHQPRYGQQIFDIISPF
ncbi:MAG: flagellar basal body L-ring protein FlgH [Pseudomonadota bacterium]